MRLTTKAMRRILRWAGGSLGVALVAMTIVHLPPVRRVLAAHGHTGGAFCPLGYGPQANPAAQRARNAALRGDTAAHTRPALGFALDVTTASDLERWARAHAISCDAKHGRAQLDCTGVPAALLPGGALGLSSVSFQMSSTGTLASIIATRRDRDPAPVSSAFVAVQDQLTRQAGAPTTTAGSARPEVLAHGLLRQASVEYRFTDYRAVVRATNMGKDFLLTEEYATLVD